MTHTPAVDSLERDPRYYINGLPEIARNLRAEGQTSRANVIEGACRMIRELTRPPGGSERLRERIELVADKLGAMLRGWSGSTADTRDALTAELRNIAALASPQAEQRQEGNIAENHPESANVCNRGDTERPADRVDGGDGYGRRAQAGAGVGAHGLGAGVLHNGHAEPSKDRDSAGNLAATHVATPHPNPAATQGDAWPAACNWPPKPFTVRDEPGEHDPCWLIFPGGEMLALKHHATNGVDQARAQFIADACNAALSSPPGVQAAQVSDLSEALLLMTRAAYPVSNEIDPRGYRWSIAYLDEALPIARAALKHLAQPGSAAHGGEDDHE